MSGAALAAAVPYGPGNAGRTRISPQCKGQRNFYFKKLNEELEKKKKQNSTHAHTETNIHLTVTDTH